MRNKKNIIMMIMIVAVLLMATGYAYFSTRLNINATGNITSTWNVYFESISSGTKVGTASNAATPSVTGTSANMSVNLNLPGDSMTYSLVLKNGGTVPAVIGDINAVATGSSAIIYSISGLNIGDKLSGGASKTITIKIEYDNNVTSQPELTSKTLTVTIDAVQDIGQSITTQTPSVEQPLLLSSQILRNNNAQSDDNLDFSKTSEEDGTSGLYYTSTNTEDGKTTYYFRGAVDNNYVKFGTQTKNTCKYNGKDVAYIDMESFLFEYNPTQSQCTTTNVCQVDFLGTGDYSYFSGLTSTDCSEALSGTLLTSKATYTANVTEDILWRVVRINEDGSIRIITESAVGSSAFNSNYRGHGYVGYMYGTIGSNTYLGEHANTNNSTIKNYLDDWYVDNLKTNYSGLLADAGFCNDRSLVSGLGYGNSYTEYGAWDRLYTNKTPQFACPNASHDLFTLKTSTKGNKALDNPVGLLTADEIAYAGNEDESFNSSYYLNNGGVWWTMSPYYSGDSDGLAWSERLGGVFNDVVDFGLGVRPVVNLKSTVDIISGDGRKDTSYVIKTN